MEVLLKPVTSELELLLARKAKLEVELEQTCKAIASELRCIQDQISGRLTPRELQVLELIRGGRQDKEIADALRLTKRGAKFHVSNILGKFGAQSRTELQFPILVR